MSVKPEEMKRRKEVEVRSVRDQGKNNVIKDMKRRSQVKGGRRRKREEEKAVIEVAGEARSLPSLQHLMMVMTPPAHRDGSFIQCQHVGATQPGEASHGRSL